MSFTTDATSGKGIPQNATEWGDSTISPYFDVPDNLYKCQEPANTSLADSIGSVTLNKASNFMLWQQSISGWSQLGILISALTGGAVNGFISSNSNLQIDTQSSMWLLYVKYAGTPTTLTNLMNLGGGEGIANQQFRASCSASPARLSVGIAGSIDTPDTHDPNAVAVQPIVIQYDKTNLRYRLYCMQDFVDYGAAFVTADVPATFSIGSINSTPCGPFYLLYAAHWKGAKAEKASWQVRLGLDALLWSASSTPFFNVAFSQSVSEALTTAESVAATFAASAPLTEAEAETESIAVTTSAPIAETDSLTTTESLAAALDALAMVSESEAVAESTANMVAFAPSLTDTLDETEAIAVVHTTSQGLSEGLAIAESTNAQYQPLAVLSEAYTISEAVAATGTPGLNYWDGLFPGPSRSYFGPLFPVFIPLPSVAVAVGPAGVATFAIDLLSGFKMRFSWRTDIIKAWDGGERQRVSQWSLPRQVYSGQAYLIGTDTRAIRARLARYAALGKPFLLGLAFEEATVSTDSFDDEVDVFDTSVLDWAVLGQRVLIIDEDGNSVGAVLQRVSPTQFGLDIAPGSVARRGSRVMPAFPIFLEPQQNFARYPTPDGVETWSIDARAIMFGFEQLGTSAFVVLSVYTSGHLNTAIATFAVEGVVGNGLGITFVAGSTFDHGNVTISGSTLTFHFKSTVTTILDAINALRPLSVNLVGAFIVTNALVAGVDEFGPAVMTGGSDRIFGNMGNGASLTFFSGQYVWDKRLQLDGSDSIADLVQSMTEIVDFSAILFDVQEATQPDWGRGVAISSDDPMDWQWLKKFLSTVQGRRRIFRLPTWRADLDVVSVSPGTIMIRGPSEAEGDFFAWYPDMRQFIQVLFSDDFVLYCFVRDATDNMDGTITLGVNTSDADYDEGGGASTRTDAVLTSWLESARFESDDFDITWQGHIFSMHALARVVR